MRGKDKIFDLRHYMLRYRGSFNAFFALSAYDNGGSCYSLRCRNFVYLVRKERAYESSRRKKPEILFGYFKEDI